MNKTIFLNEVVSYSKMLWGIACYNLSMKCNCVTIFCPHMITGKFATNFVYSCVELTGIRTTAPAWVCKIGMIYYVSVSNFIYKENFFCRYL